MGEEGCVKALLVRGFVAAFGLPIPFGSRQTETRDGRVVEAAQYEYPPELVELVGAEVVGADVGGVVVAPLVVSANQVPSTP